VTRNFYQNHRKYFNSKVPDQLKGSILSASDASDCEPVIYNKDLYVKNNLNGQPLDPEKVAHPCGSMARSVFNGNVKLIKTVIL
jgi:LEM3 (ligand-effect modulator 3) family / CDC50 family